MALFKCPDCGNAVSDAAMACPHCGMPFKLSKGSKPAKARAGVPAWLVIATFVGLAWWIYGNAVSSSAPAIAETASPATATAASTSASDDTDKPKVCDATDAQCAFDNNAGDIIVDCQNVIASKSGHTVKWDDGLFNPVFLTKQWDSNAHTKLSMLGDAVEFQNDYGAWTPMSYSCTYDLTTKKVTDVTMFYGKFKSDGDAT